MKKKIIISVTAKRAKIENEFEGVVILEDTQNGNKIKYNYLSGDPLNTEIYIVLFNKEEKFSFKAFPNRKLFEKLTKREQCIIATVLEFISGTIISAKALSHKKTQLMREVRGFDISRERDWPLELPQENYELIFEKK